MTQRPSPYASFSLVKGCLIVTLLGEVGVETLRGLRSDLLTRLTKARATGVILDVSAVVVLDPSDALAIRDILKMCALLGAEAMLVGLSVDIVMALVNLDTPLGDLASAASVEDAIDTLMSLRA